MWYFLGVAVKLVEVSRQNQSQRCVRVVHAISVCVCVCTFKWTCAVFYRRVYVLLCGAGGVGR